MACELGRVRVRAVAAGRVGRGDLLSEFTIKTHFPEFISAFRRRWC